MWEVNKFRTPKFSQNVRGMTLIELLIVVALIVTFTGFIAVNFSPFFKSRTPEFVVKELASYMKYLQFKTIEEGKVYKLKIEEDGLAAFQQNEKHEFSRVQDSFSKYFGKKGNLTYSMKDGREIYFFPDGTVTQSAISVLENEQPIATLSVTNRIGNIKVESHG